MFIFKTQRNENVCEKLKNEQKNSDKCMNIINELYKGGG